MITAILALVGTIVGGVFGAVKNSQAAYEQRQAERQGNIDYARAKELSFYSTYSNQELAKLVIVVVGFIGIAAMVFYFSRKKA